jgi:hypothetical protein
LSQGAQNRHTGILADRLGGGVERIGFKTIVAVEIYTFGVH